MSGTGSYYAQFNESGRHSPAANEYVNGYNLKDNSVQAIYGKWILDTDEDDRGRHSSNAGRGMEKEHGERYPDVDWLNGEQGTVNLPVLVPMHSSDERQRSGMLEIPDTLRVEDVRLASQESYCHLSEQKICTDLGLQQVVFPRHPHAGTIVIFRDADGTPKFQVEWVSAELRESPWLGTWFVVLDDAVLES